MDKNSTIGTFVFAAIMVIVVGGILAVVAVQLKPIQQNNVTQEKMQNILQAVKVEVTRADAKVKYDEVIKEEDRIVLNYKGEVVDGVAFDVKLKKELKKPIEEQQFPLYIATLEGGKKYYIIPVRGKGLWGPVWGYIAIQDDYKTVYGATFDHKGETPGLGAEITTDGFQNSFIGKTIMENGVYAPITVEKTGAKGDHEVDAISGATITSKGVSDMIALAIEYYIPYFESIP